MGAILCFGSEKCLSIDHHSHSPSSRYYTYLSIYTSVHLTFLDNATLGQSYVNNTLLQSQIIHNQRKLQKPNFESKLLIAGGVSLLSYCHRNIRNIIKTLNAEIQNLFGADWHLFYSDIFNSSFYQVFTSRFGENAVDQWTSLVSFAKDIHNVLFYLNYQYLLLVYRLFHVRMVTSSPKQSVRYYRKY